MKALLATLILLTCSAPLSFAKGYNGACKATAGPSHCCQALYGCVGGWGPYGTSRCLDENDPTHNTLPNTDSCRFSAATCRLVLIELCADAGTRAEACDKEYAEWFAPRCDR